MFKEFADLGDPQIIARGGGTFFPDAQFSIPQQDMGEVDISTSDEVTYQERYSRKHLTRNLLSRTANQQTKTIDITFYDIKDLTRFMKNLGKVTVVNQPAGTDGEFPVNGAPAYNVTIKGQVASLGKYGVYDVVVLAGAVELVEGEDYVVIAPAGMIEFLKPQVGAITATFSYIEWDIKRTAVGTLPEVRGILTILGVAEDDQSQELEQYYIGVAPNGQINRVTGDDGEQGWAVQGRVYTNPFDTANPNGVSDILPTMAAIEAIANP